VKTRNGFVSNSSSSSFIVMTNHTEQEIRDILQKMITFHNDIYGKSLQFSDIFLEPTLVDENILKLLKEFDSDILERHKREDLIGKKFEIRSASDNTIPYYMHLLISQVFNSENTHLG